VGARPDQEPEVVALLGSLACLRGQSFQVEDLHGGLTNRNLKVTMADRSVVVRIWSESAGLLAVDRENEYSNSVAAASTGVGAPVVEYRPELGVLVVEYIDATTCTPDDLYDLDRLDRIAQACRRLHGGPRFRDDFNMFELQRRYLSLVEERGFRLPEDYLDFRDHAHRIEQALALSDEGTVPCNNDLLAGNCLDDGTVIRLIDFEYSGNNDPCFELGNLWSEATLPLEQLEAIIASYYGTVSPQKVARSRLQGLMSKYGWTLWASIQDGAAEIDFDFWSWGMEKYERAVDEFRSGSFERLLSDSAGDPA
jgi:thiamine kinase-like enzyme